MSIFKMAFCMLLGGVLLAYVGNHFGQNIQISIIGGLVYAILNK